MKVDDVRSNFVVEFADSSLLNLMVWVAIPNKDLFRILLRPSQPASTDRNFIRRVKIICRNSAIRRFVNKTFCVEILRWTTPSFLRMIVKTWWYLPPPQGHWVSIQEKTKRERSSLLRDPRQVKGNFFYRWYFSHVLLTLFCCAEWQWRWIKSKQE